MRIITTPTYDWLRRAISRCSRQFLVSSPYVGPILPRLCDGLGNEVDRTLVTKTDLRDFALGASDVDALCEMAAGRAAIFSLPRLHAKTYVIDQASALVTSANATEGGMRRNWECGICIDDSRQVRRIAQLALSGFGAGDALQSWTQSEIAALREPVAALRSQLPRIRRIPDLDVTRLPSIRLSRRAEAALVGGVAGWTQLVLEGILSQSDDEFALDQICSACAAPAASRFPRNRHVRPKIRQQLHRLRDLGLVEFLGGGTYRRTVHV